MTELIFLGELSLYVTEDVSFRSLQNKIENAKTYTYIGISGERCFLVLLMHLEEATNRAILTSNPLFLNYLFNYCFFNHFFSSSSTVLTHF